MFGEITKGTWGELWVQKYTELSSGTLDTECQGLYQKTKSMTIVSVGRKPFSRQCRDSDKIGRRNVIGKPCEGKPHARFDGGNL